MATFVLSSWWTIMVLRASWLRRSIVITSYTDVILRLLVFQTQMKVKLMAMKINRNRHWLRLIHIRTTSGDFRYWWNAFNRMLKLWISMCLIKILTAILLNDMTIHGQYQGKGHRPEYFKSIASTVSTLQISCRPWSDRKYWSPSFNHEWFRHERCCLRSNYEPSLRIGSNTCGEIMPKKSVNNIQVLAPSRRTSHKGQALDYRRNWGLLQVRYADEQEKLCRLLSTGCHWHGVWRIVSFW